MAQELAARVRQVLEKQPVAELPLTYRQLAEQLALEPPRTIQRVAQALEVLMHEDAAAGRPFIAALVVSQRGEGAPAPGFFELAVALGRLPAERNLQLSAYRDEYQRALSSRSL
ncbi:hypothetical protein [Halomonas halocynthiae]|uniref:hypothetical protein n=1 Tax=Halomonas halocynthiae TaxID=176290 RepID=UPI0004115347|nr:hypothetical protein [Halomonas halocynthiae]